MKNSSIFFRFFGLLILLIIPAYLIQNNLTDEDENLRLQFTYVFNLLFTVPFVLLVIWLKNILKRYIGFIFMGLGFIKITVFLVYTKLNSIDVNRDNFLLFFIPYILCMIIEILVLVSYLNKAKF
ncbi:hypothetical protein [Flavobacterium sp. CS20]|uniref:hypothetical protein n=1 Tax=Flavobacterium sp. CS20 TaxID=2775246 RepID=UPI001B39DC4B|nr:hypothetical protein [Flavobacterium sp. CS20]QTY26058.1 hypothetical protein IGB25_08635 [Flavobacterium sp. CS20]